MSTRSFFVKLNLDDVGHATIEYDDPSSLGMWFKGYLVGAHGKPLRPDASPPQAAGHAYGLLAYQEASNFRLKQAELANRRWNADAKPMPRHPSSICQGISQGICQDACQTDAIEQRSSSNDHLEAKNEKLTPDGFDEFWEAYDKKEGKSTAQRAWRRLSKADRQAAMDGIVNYHALRPDPQYRKQPTTYLNQRTWEDEATQSTGSRASSNPWAREEPTQEALDFALEECKRLRAEGKM
jgi:hypothetical protein